MFGILCMSLLLRLVNAHLSAFHEAMYCLNGNENGRIDLNTAASVTPLYQLSKNDWWFHHINRCDEFPPAPGKFLDLPAGGEFQVEIASNRAKTTLSYNGKDATDWPDGATYPEDYNVASCITSPNIHTQNQSMAAGTAFAISYQSDITKVTADNLAVFSVTYHTPWKRVTTYSVPSALPACPAEGCICAWGWVPNGCGQANMYHQAFRCRVTNAWSTTPVADPKPPVWCEGEPEKCTKGSKQMVYWGQKEGNNIEVTGWDNAGQPKTPGYKSYNMKCGFSHGAQDDIFSGPPSGSNSNENPKTTSSSESITLTQGETSTTVSYSTASPDTSGSESITSTQGVTSTTASYSTASPNVTSRPARSCPAKNKRSISARASVPKPSPSTSGESSIDDLAATGRKRSIKTHKKKLGVKF